MSFLFLDDAVTEEQTIAFLLNAALRTDIPIPNPLKYFSDYKYGNLQNLCGTASLGRAEERTLSNCLNILRARNISTRYALFAHRQAQTDASGIAERNGNDLLISILDKDPATDPHVAKSFRTQRGDGSSCTPDDDVGADQGLKCGMNELVAATYMHELGHTLGLGHGGSDDQNCKPNYVSIMNYFLQSRDFHASRKLDYSDSVLQPLDERQVDETLGFTSPLSTVYWGHLGNLYSQAPANPPQMNSNDDYDSQGNDIIQTQTYSMDLNWYEPLKCKDKTKTVLEGHDDWSNLSFDFRRNAEGSSSLAGVSLLDEEIQELVPEALYTVAESLDSDGDGVSNADDNSTDLAASITASPTPAHVGANLTFTLTFTNQSAFPETRVTVLQELPANADFISVSSAQGKCQRNGLAVGCDLGGLNGGASTTVTVVVRPTGVGTVATSVEVTGVQQDTVTQNNTATSDVNVDP